MNALTKEDLIRYQKGLVVIDTSKELRIIPPPTSAIHPFKLLVMPYVVPGATPFLAVAAVLRFEGVADAGRNHTASIFCFKDVVGFKYLFSCGDGFLTGSIKPETADFRVNELAREYPSLKAQMTSAMAHFGADTKCGFWSSISRNKESGGCKHVRAMMAQAAASDSGKPWAVLEAMEAAYNGAVGGVAGAVEPSKPKPKPLSRGPLYREFEQLLHKDAEYKAPVLVMGPRGASKTWSARAFMRGHGFDQMVESAGHAGMEAIDFIGGMVDLGGRFVWKDGPVAKAFRAAAAGRKVVLLIDEIYRVPRRERSIFLTALSPEGDSIYRLPTGRPVDVRMEGGSEVADEEVLYAPVANLSIVATTNVGAEYEIEDDDPAQKDRWIHIFVKTEEVRLREILSDVVRARGWAEMTATKLGNFWKNTQKMREDRLVESTPNIRTLVRVVRIAKSESDVKAHLKRLALALVAINAQGEPVKEQLQAVEKAIGLEFGS